MVSETVEVRIRHDDEAKSIHLFGWPSTRLDEVLPTIRGWGIADFYGSTLVGQFVVDENRAYFEVVIANDDE